MMELCIFIFGFISCLPCFAFLHVISISFLVNFGKVTEILYCYLSFRLWGNQLTDASVKPLTELIKTAKFLNEIR